MVRRPIGYLLVTACLAMLLSACGAPQPRPADVRPTVADGQGPPPEWALEDGRELPLDTGQSRIALRVYRGGRLARMGHNHVLEVTDLRGRLKRLQGGGGLAKLVFGVEGIAVDDRAARARAGDDFAQQPDAAAIAGTRRNMLGAKVLDAANWPEVRIVARVDDLAAAAPVAEVYVSVRGVVYGYQTPVSVELRGTQARVSGALTVRQSDFGIQPFAVLGGALLVRDQVEADFVIVGRISDGPM